MSGKGEGAMRGPAQVQDSANRSLSDGARCRRGWTRLGKLLQRDIERTVIEFHLRAERDVSRVIGEPHGEAAFFVDHARLAEQLWLQFDRINATKRGLHRLSLDHSDRHAIDSA